LSFNYYVIVKLKKNYWHYDYLVAGNQALYGSLKLYSNASLVFTIFLKKVSTYRKLKGAALKLNGGSETPLFE
jgi:hypothetical protein